MKITILLTVIIASIGLILLFTKCRNKSKTKESTELAETNNDSTKTHNLNENPYEGLRNMAFEVNPEQLGITVSNGEIYGMVLDWNLGEGVMTLVTYKTGDASMYLSTGGGVIGGGKHQNVNSASKSLIELAGKYISNTIRTDSVSTPTKDCVKFYFLTTKGKYLAEEQMSNIENGSSTWLPLFEEANKVITELRLTVEK